MDVERLTDSIGKKLMPVLMRENSALVSAVEGCIEEVAEIARRMTRLESRMDKPNCPMCGKKRG